MKATGFTLLIESESYANSTLDIIHPLTQVNHNQCPNCLKPLWSDCDNTTVPGLCNCTQSKGIMGWECPKCGAGLSPHTSICPCNNHFKITYGRTISG